MHFVRFKNFNQVCQNLSYVTSCEKKQPHLDGNAPFCSAFSIRLGNFTYNMILHFSVSSTLGFRNAIDSVCISSTNSGSTVGIDAPSSSSSKNKVQKDKAVENGRITTIQYRVKASRSVGDEIGERHLPGQ